MKKTKRFSMLFCMIMMLSVIADFLADLLAIHVFNVGAFTFNGGDFVFPVVYIINDIMAEVYGYETSKRFIWYGLSVNAFALGMLTFVAWLAGVGTPIHTFAIGDFGLSASITVAIAGFVAFVVASFVNAFIMAKMKERDGESKFGKRAVVSTIFAELADTSCFYFMLCALGLYPWEIFAVGTLTTTLIKVSVEVVFLPVTKKIVAGVKELEHYSWYPDENTNYNPFSFK